MSLFIPKIYVKDIYSIDYKKLINDGYKLIIFDLDNTIGNIKEKICDKKTTDFLNNLNKDIKIIIASNSRKNRVDLKPTSKILLKIKRKYNIDYDKIVIVGDQLLTDMFLGNRKGLLTILVDQKDVKDLKITQFNRKIENIIKKKYKLKKGEYYR